MKKLYERQPYLKTREAVLAEAHRHQKASLCRMGKRGFLVTEDNYLPTYGIGLVKRFNVAIKVFSRMELAKELPRL